MYFKGKLQEIFFVAEIVPERMFMFDQDLRTGLSVIWNSGSQARFVIDGVEYKLNQHDIFFLSGLQTIDSYKFEKLKVIQFNKSFYCVENHDSEVGCKGILFFGASNTPVIKISKAKQKHFNMLWEIIIMEMNGEHDSLKVDMLQNLLKRFLILCVRLSKKQNFHNIEDSKNIGLIREYNFLVEKHYKTYTNVADYAKLLFKSPKTLSNVFKNHIDKTPLQIINDRRIIEAKRLLKYTALNVQEISDELNFKNVQSFSHFFKKNTKATPTSFRNQV